MRLRNVSIEVMDVRFAADRLTRPPLVRRLHVDLMRIFTAACRPGR
jgi:hypothetical protein